MNRTGATLPSQATVENKYGIILRWGTLQCSELCNCQWSSGERLVYPQNLVLAPFLQGPIDPHTPSPPQTPKTGWKAWQLRWFAQRPCSRRAYARTAPGTWRVPVSGGSPPKFHTKYHQPLGHHSQEATAQKVDALAQMLKGFRWSILWKPHARHLKEIPMEVYPKLFQVMIVKWNIF